MSRAFVKEDDAGEAPIIPPRAALPPNTPNYVTPKGLQLLRQEQEALEAERLEQETRKDNDAERTRQLTILKGKLAALKQRIVTAKVIEAKEQPQDEVRFGARVSLKTVAGGRKGMKREFQIVGVDEADLKQQKIAFVAPIARAVNGHKQGDEVSLSFGPKEEKVVISSLSYPA